MVPDAVFKALWRKITDVGFCGTVKLVLEQIINRILYRENLLFYVDLPIYLMKPKELNNNVTGRQIKTIDDLSLKDIISLRRYAGVSYIEAIRRRLKNNWSLFVAYIDDAIAGAGWAIDNKSGLKTKVIPLFEGDIVFIDFFTLPAFRGRKIYPFLLSFMIGHFREAQAMRAFVSANEKNTASIKGIKKAGFRYYVNYKVYNFRSNEIVVWKNILAKD